MYGAKISDAIEKLDENGSDNLIRNAGSYYVAGIEAQSRINFLRNNYLFFNLGWFRGYWNQTRWSLVTHLPQLRGTIGFNLDLPSIGSLNTTIELGSERRNNIRTDLERQRPYQIPPYTLINVAFLTKPILKYFVLEGRIFNLFNFQNRDDLLRPDTFPNLVQREGLTWYIGLLAMI